MKATIIGELTADAGLPQDLQRTFLATMGTKTRQLSEPVRLLYRIKEDEPLARFLESIKSEAGQTTEEQT